MMDLEADHEEAFVDWCHARGVECLKLRVDGVDGFPDRTVITPRGVCFFEFKKRGGRLRPQQRKMIDRLRKQGRSVFVVFSFQEAKGVFCEWYNERTKGSDRGGPSGRSRS